MKRRVFLNLIIIASVALLPVFPTYARDSSRDAFRDRANVVRNAIPKFTVRDFNLDKPHVKNELLIKFAPGAPEKAVSDVINALGSPYSDDLTANRAVRVSVSMDRLRSMREFREMRDVKSDEILTGVLSALMLDPMIEYVEPNYVAKGFSAPNDTYYDFQWNFPIIGMEDAWEYSTGKDVVVAIIDTGVAYENYAGYVRAKDFKNTNFVPGYDFVNEDSRPNDDNGHGTHVAGTVAASTNDEYGSAGIAYGASIMPVKVLNRDLSGTYADIIDGIYFAVDNGADIINLSLGGPAYSQALLDAVRYAYENNVLVVVASGNDGGGKVMYPAAYDDYVLAVGGVDYDKQRAKYSNYGPELDIMAPGGDVDSDKNRDGYPDGILQETLKQLGRTVLRSRTSFYFYQGTSMAAPHVSGVAALVKSMGIESVDDIMEVLTKSAEDLGDSGWDEYTGWGLLRADKAVEYANNMLYSSSNTEQTEEEINQPDEDTAQPANEDSASSSSDMPDSTQDQNTTDGEPSGDSANDSSNDSDEQTTNDQTEDGLSGENDSNPEDSVANQDEEESLSEMTLKTNTYNMWGRIDSRFVFWEKVFLGISAEDADKNALSNVEFIVRIYDESDTLMAEGGGVSDEDGELLLDLGKFARGTYTAVTKAVKEGFESVIDTVKFRFR